MKNARIDDEERELWCLNHEGLYLAMGDWCRRNRGGKRGFIRANRDTIDAVIESGISASKRSKKK